MEELTTEQLQALTCELENCQEALGKRTAEVEHFRSIYQQQQNYYQTALLAIVDNLKAVIRTIALLAGKVD